MALIKCGVVRVITNLIWGQVCEVSVTKYALKQLIFSRGIRLFCKIFLGRKSNSIEH